MDISNGENSKKEMNQNQFKNAEKISTEEEESKKQESNQNSSQSKEIYSHSKEFKINPNYIKLENEEQINCDKILYNQLYQLSIVMENIDNFSNSNYENYVEWFNSYLNIFLNNNIFNNYYLENNPLLSQAVFKLVCIYFKNVTKNINYLQKNEFDCIINYLKCNKLFFNNYDTKNADKNNDKETHDINIFQTLIELCPNLKNLEFCSKKCVFNFFYKYLSLYLNEIDFYNKFFTLAFSKENEYLSDFQSFFSFYDTISELLLILDEKNFSKTKIIQKMFMNYKKRFQQFLKSDEYKKMDKNIINVIIYKHINICFNLMDINFEENKKDFYSDFIETLKFEFDICKDYFDSKNLEKKITCVLRLGYLCDLITNFYSKKPKDIYFVRYENINEFYEIEKNILINFLKDFEIYKKIFVENIHEAIITHSKLLFKFLYQNKIINKKEIKDLWKVSTENNQGVSNSILNLFSELMKVISEEDSNLIFDTIFEIKENEINDFILKILENFMGNTKNEKLIKLLYKYSNELLIEQNLSENIVINSRILLANCLLMPENSVELKQIISNSLNCIANNCLINTHLDILNQIVKFICQKNEDFYKNLFGENVKNYKDFLLFYINKENLIDDILSAFLEIKKEIIFFVEENNNIDKNKITVQFYLNKLFNYLGVNKDNNNNINKNKDSMDIDTNTKENLFSSNNFEDYKESKEKLVISFINCAKEIKNSNNNNKNINNINKISYFLSKLSLNFFKQNYYSIIEDLFSFLIHIINHTNYSLTKNQITFLYQLFVKNSIGEDFNKFFNFLENIFDNLEEKDFILFDLFKNLNYNKLPYSSYILYKKYFFSINKYYKNIEINDDENNNNIDNNMDNLFDDKNSIVSIKNFNLLISFQTILGYYLYNNDEKIHKDSLEVLKNVFEIVTKKNNESEILYQLLFETLEKINNNNNNNNNNNLKTIDKILVLINIVLNSNKYYEKTFNNEKIFNENNFKIEVINKFDDENNQTKIPLIINLNNTVSKLKEIVKEKILFNDNIKNSDIIISFDNKNCIPENTIIKNFNFKMDDLITILNVDNENKKKNEDKISKLKENFIEMNNDLLYLALKNCNFDFETTVNMLHNENFLNNINKKYNEMNQNKNINNENKTLNNFIFTEKKIDNLINLLNINDEKEKIKKSVLKVLSNIYYPENILGNILNKNYEIIFKNYPKNKPKLFLYLILINSFVFENNFYKNIEFNLNLKNIFINEMMSNKNKELDLIFNYIKSINNNNNNNNNKCNKIDLENIYILINWIKLLILKSCDLINEEKLKNVCQKIYNNNIEERKLNNVNVDENSVSNFIEYLIKNNIDELIFDLIKNIINFDFNYVENILKDVTHILLLLMGINEKFIENIINLEIKNNCLLKIVCDFNNKIIRKEVCDFFKNVFIYINYENNENENNQIDNNNNNNNKNNEMFENLFKHIRNSIKKIFSNEIKTREFYELLSKVFSLSRNFSNNKFLNDFNIKDFTYKLMLQIISITKNNEFEKNETEIERLYGILNILRSLFDLNCDYVLDGMKTLLNDKKINLIDYLYNCIFINDNNNNNNQTIFTNNDLREITLKIFIQSIKYSKNLKSFLLPKILSQHSSFSLDSNAISDIYINLREKSDTFIGLKNYGATCYLNSLVQQLFMMPFFKESLFKFNINKTNIENSQIFNLQELFYNLSYSNKKYFPCYKFIQSFKSAFNGEPINVGIQQDTDEFFGILCEELEKEAKIYKNENFLEKSFKGKISNEIYSIENEYPYYSCTDEDYFRITLDIKGKKNLNEALNNFIQEEILDGDNKYLIEKYNKKIAIKKRVSIKNLSNNLIIHLKRFELDYNTFKLQKIIDYLSFPLEINFRNYTRIYLNSNKDIKFDQNERKNLDEKEMDYVLTGILVHNGSTLQHGHYYSFIMDQKTRKWFKFDDTRISEFDIENDLENECFGNKDLNSNKNSKSAYLLIYTKKNNLDKNNLNDKFNVNKTIIENVRKENLDFIKNRHYFEENYFNFIRDFVKKFSDNINIEENNFSSLTKELRIKKNSYEKLLNVLKNNNNQIDNSNVVNVYNNIYNEEKKNIPKKNPDDSKIIKFIFYYTFRIILNLNNQSKISFFKEILYNKIHSHPKISFWWFKNLEKNPNFFRDFIFNKNHEIRKIFYSITMEAFQNVYICEKNNDIFRKTFKIIIRENNNKLESITEDESILNRFIKNIIYENMEQSRLNWLFNNYFCYLCSKMFVNYELNIHTQNLIDICISLITNNKNDKYKSKTNPNFFMGNNYNQFNKQSYIDILIPILLNYRTKVNREEKVYDDYYTGFKEDNHDINQISDENNSEILFDFNQNLYQKIINKKFLCLELLSTNGGPNIKTYQYKLLYHLCYKDLNISKIILDDLNSLIREHYNCFELTFQYIRNLDGIFSIEDEFSFDRCNFFFNLNSEEDSMFKCLYNYKEMFTLATVLNLSFFVRIIENYSSVNDYFSQNVNSIKWVIGFLNSIDNDEQQKYNFSLSCSNINFIHFGENFEICKNFYFSFIHKFQSNYTLFN